MNEKKDIFCPWFWNWPAKSSIHPGGNVKGSRNKETLGVFLSRTILAQQLCQMAIKVFDSIYTTVMCKCTDNYNSSRWLKLEFFSSLLTKILNLSFGRRSLNNTIAIFVWQTHAFKFFIQQSLQMARMSCHLPLVAFFARSASGSFVIYKSNKSEAIICKYISVPNDDWLDMANLALPASIPYLFTISNPTSGNGTIVKWTCFSLSRHSFNL